jgi:hypothetical protein
VQNPPIVDDRTAGGVRQYTDQLRKLGLIGEIPAAIGQDREASPDPVSILQDGMPPMIRTVQQPDRR